jgi:signal transduction histidine kinase/CheY-like chemotaxis protein
MAHALLIVAVVLQAIAVAYGLYLLGRRQGAAGAWLFLLGAMCSMLVWRIVTLAGIEPPAFFNPLIAIWGSTCMLAAMALFGREVATRKRLESERIALLDSERAARRDAERASRLKDEFLATLSHELRSPLTAILNWCTVTRSPRCSGDERTRAIEVIERNARAQARLVDDLLDVTRMTGGGAVHLDLLELSIAGPVTAAVQAVRPAADAKGVWIGVTVADELPRVLGDADRLQQVATNLIVNAVKFTPAGGRVDVSLTRAGAEVALVVADTGEGIAPEFLPHVFARFRQADGSTARRHGGLGLGLAIVDHLVRSHGGTVRASSAGLGRGAAFTVLLPVATTAADARPVGDDRAPTAEPFHGALSGLRILLIDDEADVRASVARLLETLGADVVALEDGTDVAARLQQYRPDLLVIDISMPGEDGYALLRRVRRLPASAGGRTPAVSLTAHARSEDRDRALQAGFQAHLPKPIDLPQFLAAVREVTGPAAAPRSVNGLR